MYAAIKDEQAKRGEAPKPKPKPTDTGDFPTPKGGKGGGAQDDRAAQLQQETRGIEREYHAQTEIIRREQDLQLTSLQDATTRIIQAEKDRYDALVESLDKQLTLAKKESEREGIRGQLRDALLERDRNVQAAEDAQYKEQRAALEAHAQAMLEIGEMYDAQRIASIQASADLRATTYERAEERIGKIESEAFKRRLEFNRALIKALHASAGFEFDAAGDVIANDQAQARLNLKVLGELQDESSKIIAQWDNTIVVSERRRSEARKKDLENAREWAREMRELEWSVLRAALQVGQMDVDRMRRRNIDRRDVAKAQADLDREEEQLKHEAIVQEQEDRRQNFNQEVHTFEERIAALIAFNQARELEKERHRRRNKEIEDQEKQESGEGGDLLDPLRAILNERVSLHEFAAQAIASSFDVITDAMAATLQTYILTGELSGKMLRKAVAEQIAALAALALKQGLYWTAQGIADLFWNPPRAAGDFAAAGLFFALAGAGAFVGRKVAGNAFQDQAAGVGAGAGAGGGGEDRQVQYAPFTYNSGASPSSQVAGEGSQNVGGNSWQRTVIDAINRQTQVQAETNAQLSRIRSMPHGDALAIGAGENPRAIGAAVIEDMNGNHTRVIEMLNNLGFAK